MEVTAALVAVAALAAGGFLLVSAVTARSRLASGDPAEYLRSLDEEEGPTDAFEQMLDEPFFTRVVRPLGGGALRSIASLTPRNYLEKIHKQLVQGGISSSVRAEEFVTAQILMAAGGLVLAMLYVVLGEPSARIGVLALVLGPAVGALIPGSWLSRKVQERKDAIRKDLPDTLDLLSISVEAGMGFEGALDVVTTHFQSPLAEEFSRTLKEMELGLARREALHNLKRRTEVPELSNFVLTLTQADALGMPIGRILKTQAAEMRTKRRQWAREKAGKLPVKILFPLVLFIFPPTFIIILGPAASEIARAF